MTIALNKIQFSGGQTLDSDTITGGSTYEIQTCKIKTGATGVDGGLVTNSNPLPVAIQNGVPGQQDGASFAEGTAAGLPIMGIANETSPGVLTEGEAGIVRLTFARDLKTAALPVYGGFSYKGLSYQIQRVLIAVSASGATALVAAAGAGLIITVIQYKLLAVGAVNVKFQSASSDITGLDYLSTDGGVVVPYSPVGWFDTAANAALNINLSGAVAVGGVLSYIVHP